MSNELSHHGIKDQKWGLRRFQNPDGSLTPAGRERYGVGKERGTAGAEGQSKSGEGGSSQKSGTNKTPGKSSRSATAMSDDELRSRINRLNMEEQYSNLVARQKQRNTSVVKSLLGNAAKQLAEQSLSRLVSKVVSKAFDEKKETPEPTPPFSIEQYKDMDVYKMDGDTIKAVADWYTKAGLITKQRKAISSDEKKD